MHHRPSSSKQTGGPGPTLPPNEVMGCSSMRAAGTYHHHNNILPPISISTSPIPIPIPTPTPTPTSLPTPLQLFNPPTTFKFQDMAATLGFPFTPAQWKELESQAMIYKYMMASVPVPYELLLPIIQNLPASHSPLVTQLRYSSKQDLEPGRCKRTDGKKWRCARDVAPNQKYCERHMHRGRPRSRKHVELSTNPSSSSSSLPNNNNKKTRLPNASQSNPGKVLGSTVLPSATEPPLYLEMQSKIVNNSGGDWDMEGGSEQQWRQIMQSSRNIFNTDFGEQQPPLDLPSFTDFGTPRRDFFDAWSTNKSNGLKDSSIGNVSPSGLDLSMAMASEEEGFGVTGGPLAEVLRPSLLAVGSNPTSPYPTGDGDSISPPATTMSSPSGVLQRTMLSLSDGSVCNSPTPAASSTTPTPTDIVGFQWFT